jgi:Flp pilus assembly protein TadG
MLRAVARIATAGNRLAKDTVATTAIEFAIIAPVLFAILFATVAFGVQYATRVAITYAAAEGGRAAVAGLNDTERASLATTAITNTLNALSPLVDPTKASVTVALGNEGTDKTVSISIGYSDTRFAQMPFLPDLTGLQPVTVQYYVTDPSG